MKKVELLSPVGNKECLEAAIKAGADAVYLSGKNYGARKFAGNFETEELIQAIEYSHLYGVKVYVTVNTMIYEQEIEQVFKYLELLYINNVDAIIVQDIGLINLIHKRLPELEVHASTQCHNHNNQGIELLKKIGVTRVVLDREMSLEEIQKIKKENIEIEVFIHGALCVCYSGCCLFSSLNGGRSGNRGECVQSCRLPYKLLKNNKYISTKGDYLLSTRELNTINNIQEIIESGVDSLKIEGRMKSASYVGIVTKLYRTYIDKYYNHEDTKVSNEDIEKLAKIFNRKFTSGYINGNKEIMNPETPNHQGIEIGKVIDVNNNKITIKLFKTLNQNDGIRFKNSQKGMIVNKLYNKNNLLIKSSQDIAIIDNKIGLKTKDIILKTIDYELENSIKNIEPKKIPVNYKVEAYKNKNIRVTLSDNINEVSYIGDKVEEALTNPINFQKIKYQLSKLGDTIYKLNNIEINMDDDIFINIKSLNEIRRELVNKLNKKRIEEKKNIIIHKYDDISKNVKDSKIRLNILVRTEEQLKACLLTSIDSIYVTDYNLYLKYKNKYNDLYYRTDRVNINYQDIDADKILITELGAINKYKDKTIASDYYLNVANNESIKYLENIGVTRITLSIENNYNYLKYLNFNNHNIEIIIYGRIELMITKYCPLKLNLNHCNKCINDNDNYFLEDKYKNNYPIIKDKCLNHIIDCKIINYVNNINDYINLGINNYRIELFNENKEETIEIIDNIKKRMKKYER